MTSDKFTNIAGGITAPKGFKAAGVAAGIKKKSGNKDLAIIYSEQMASAAGVFTTNKVKAAPLMVTMANLEDGKAQGIVVNAGNANACTGEQGKENALAMAGAAASKLGLGEKDMLVTSTGVIGVQLPMDRIITGITKAAEAIAYDGGKDAAQAIMTTDTYAKELALKVVIGGKEVTLGAMAKGSGMIHPNMATMLGFVTSDAAIEPGLLKQALRYAIDKSFNMITVDGDTSTNDMVVVLANGMAGNQEITAENEDYVLFRDALAEICIIIAKEIARDGEGATKLIEATVKGARNIEDARKAAKAIVGSNLFKCAVFGADANWGRVICAVGYSGAEFDASNVDIYLGHVKTAEKGVPLDFSEEEAKEVLEQKEVKVLVDLGEGEAEATAWGCDLTYDYVKINGSYRT